MLLAVEVLAHMNQSRITCVFVVEDRRPVGPSTCMICCGLGSCSRRAVAGCHHR